MGYTNGAADAVNKTNIKYTYHQHSGNSTNGGGCYGKIVYKTTQVICGSTKARTICGSYQAPSSTTGEMTTHCYYKCPDCGTVTTQGSGACTGYITKTTSDVDHYELNCGKTTSTIESATIIF